MKQKRMGKIKLAIIEMLKYRRISAGQPATGGFGMLFFAIHESGETSPTTLPAIHIAQSNAKTTQIVVSIVWFLFAGNRIIWPPFYIRLNLNLYIKISRLVAYRRL
jgi:hypothetical protein